LSRESFDALPPANVDPTIVAPQAHLDDQTVISLFGAFEAALIDHVVDQEAHIRKHAISANTILANKLADLYKSFCRKKISAYAALGTI